jgi:4-hydroxy-4-methyl-2-oxoglutarate aldolase
MSVNGTSAEASIAQRAALFREIETATLGHILTEGFMVPAIQCVIEGPRVCGPAFTVSVPPDDGAVLSCALAQAKPGDVLVIDRQGDDRHACWGAVMTAAAQAAGIVGVVIDGFVTDVAAIRESGLPVWCRGRSPLTTKLIGKGGTIGETVRCGGVQVRPGDLVLADENGVCVIDPAAAEALARTCTAMQAAEPGIIERVRKGEHIDEINGARKLFEKLRGSKSH